MWKQVLTINNDERINEYTKSMNNMIYQKLRTGNNNDTMKGINRLLYQLRKEQEHLIEEMCNFSALYTGNDEDFGKIIRGLCIVNDPVNDKASNQIKDGLKKKMKKNLTDHLTENETLGALLKKKIKGQIKKQKIKEYEERNLDQDLYISLEEWIEKGKDRFKGDDMKRTIEMNIEKAKYEMENT